MSKLREDSERREKRLQHAKDLWLAYHSADEAPSFDNLHRYYRNLNYRSPFTYILMVFCLPHLFLHFFDVFLDGTIQKVFDKSGASSVTLDTESIPKQKEVGS